MSETTAAVVLTEESQEYRTKPVRYTQSREFLQLVRGAKSHAQIATSLSQAKEQQLFAHSVVMGLRQDWNSAKSAKERKDVAVALRQAVLAYQVASECVRIAKGKPLPGYARPEDKKLRRKSGLPQSSTFTEPPPKLSPSGPEAKP
jgi:hypothetical protein